MLMIKKPVSELEGAQLDWAVAKAEGLAPMFDVLPLIQKAVVWVADPEGVSDFGPNARKRYTPSVMWSQGGPLIERELIDIEWWKDPNDSIGWDAIAYPSAHQRVRLDGPTPLIAAMRAFVASKLGDVVEVPA